MNEHEHEMTKQHLDTALGDGAGLVRAIEAADWEAVAVTVESLDVHELQALVVALASMVGSAHGAGYEAGRAGAVPGGSLGRFLDGVVEHAHGSRA
ncbi:hypothetical protein F7P69_00850 [Cellulosimicrobium funkei]|nr:hypothetical protein [Cellulosimicrobium funkei]